MLNLENLEYDLVKIPLLRTLTLGRTRVEELRFVTEAAKRIPIISGFLKEDENGINKIYHPVDLVRRKRGEILIGGIVSSVNLKGQENLEEVRQLMIKEGEKGKEGYEITFTPAHRQDFDHTILRKQLEKEGFRDLAQRLFFFGGVKMWTRGFVAFFMPGENVLVVKTPADRKEITDMKSRDVFSEKQQQIIEDYDKKFEALSEQSKPLAQKLKKEGMIAVFYPETTRSRDGYLVRAPREVSAILAWGRHNTYVVPITSDGIREGWKPGKAPNFKNIFLRRVPVSIIVGKPYLEQEIWERDFTGLMLNGIDATPGDYAMAKIAELNWDIVRPQERKFYEKVLDAPKRVSKKIEESLELRTTS